MSKTSCNLVTIWGKTEVNMAHKQGSNCIRIAASLYLHQKLHFKVQQKIASKIACVNRPLVYT